MCVTEPAGDLKLEPPMLHPDGSGPLRGTTCAQPVCPRAAGVGVWVLQVLGWEGGRGGTAEGATAVHLQAGVWYPDAALSTVSHPARHLLVRPPSHTCVHVCTRAHTHTRTRTRTTHTHAHVNTSHQHEVPVLHQHLPNLPAHESCAPARRMRAGK